MKLERNRDATVTYREIGLDRNPVLIVDDVLTNVDEVRAYLLDARFNRTVHGAGYYPGYSTAADGLQQAELFHWVMHEVISRRYADTIDIKSINLDHNACASFSGMFAPNPNGDFCVVHTDPHSFLASILYISPDLEEETGTAFWEHKELGIGSFLSMDSLVYQQHLQKVFGVQSVNVLLEAFGPNPLMEWPDYDTAVMGLGSPEKRMMKCNWPDTEHFQFRPIDKIAARYNRLVIYPTWQFHSIYYPNYKPPASIDKARLTINGFLDYPFGQEFTCEVADIPGLIPAG